MQYVITNLWKLPDLSHHSEQSHPAPTEEAHTLLAAACRDCGQYNFPPKATCRYCGSPRIRTVSLEGRTKANPGAFVFGAADQPPKPN